MIITKSPCYCKNVATINVYACYHYISDKKSKQNNYVSNDVLNICIMYNLNTMIYTRTISIRDIFIIISCSKQNYDNLSVDINVYTNECISTCVCKT